MARQGERPAYQIRVIEEKQELDDKLHRLDAFIGTRLFAQLDPAEQARLRRQATHMLAYSNVLGERIRAFDE